MTPTIWAARRTVPIAVAVLVAGCGGNGVNSAQPPGSSSTSQASTTTTTATTGRWLIETSDAHAGGKDAPMLLVTDGTEVNRLANGRVTRVGKVEGTTGVAVGDGVGTVVVEMLQPQAQSRPVPVRLVRLEEGGKAVPLDTMPADEVHLYDAVIVDGASHVLYGAARFPDDDEPSGDVVLHNLATGKRRDLFPAFAPEFFTHRGSAAADTIVTSASSDLTETFALHRLDGTDAPGWHNPTDELPYNMPPLLADAVLSPAADALAYLSGPDWDGLTQERVGRWELVVVAPDGKEIRRLPLGNIDRELTRLDFDGRWAVISSTSPNGTPQPPLLIDTHADRAVGQILSAVVGTATIDSAARSTNAMLNAMVDSGHE